MTSIKSLFSSSAIGLAAFALVAGCSPSGDSDAADSPNTTNEPSSSAETSNSSTPDTSSQSREARVAEALEEIEGTMAQAKETTGPGSPAMWTLADDDTIIHIFGTVHVLKPDLEWRTDAFDNAFNAADKLVFELDLHSPEGQQAIGTAMIGAAMFTDGQTLRDVLNDEDEAIVAEAASGLGIPLASMDPVEPWFAALNLMNAQWMKDGFDPNSGVEMVLVEEATQQGKSFGFLETAELQAGVFDGLGIDTQIDMLVEGAMTLEYAGPMLDNLTAEWADGDVTGLGLIAANPDAAGGEEFYDALFLNRNQAWVPQIEQMLEEDTGTIMIAVGAGHLAGPDSVITMLEDKGHTLTRVQ